MNYKTILNVISTKYKEILESNLVGIYVHGSIAFNCFNWNKSDIDFLVVVNEKLSESVKLRLLEVLESLRAESPPKGFEMSVVLKEHCINFQYPTPYELHFSNQWLETYLTNPLLLCDDNYKTDKDLAAHLTIIRHVGIALCGEPIKEVFGDVPKDNYIDSIKNDIENATVEILHNPMYIVLNLCRVAAYIKDNLILSKEQGGNWGLRNLPKEYRDIVNEALKSYMSSGKMTIKEVEAQKFCDYMLVQVFS
ncbi:aminoglycoside adenylyltransferase domain-containing protein [Clostridium sp.]|uniref:aminoglycoside adenylyltransferase domain-containing protein n=1 Tax=Clostridium sp. TaxID=1506 RepID=UPI002FC97D77